MTFNKRYVLVFMFRCVCIRACVCMCARAYTGSNTYTGSKAHTHTNPHYSDPSYLIRFIQSHICCVIHVVWYNPFVTGDDMKWIRNNARLIRPNVYRNWHNYRYCEGRHVGIAATGQSMANCPIVNILHRGRAVYFIEFYPWIWC